MVLEKSEMNIEHILIYHQQTDRNNHTLKTQIYRYDTVSASVMTSVRKLDESESGVGKSEMKIF